MLQKILLVMGLADVPLILLSTLGCVAVFAIAYLVIYAFTARLTPRLWKLPLTDGKRGIFVISALWDVLQSMGRAFFEVIGALARGSWDVLSSIASAVLWAGTCGHRAPLR